MLKQLVRVMTITTLSIAVLLAAIGSALAVDGVIEINQARAMAGGVTPGDAPGFPVNISLPGSYRLTSNLDVSGEPNPQNVTAISITPSEVTIDLNGFAILGPVVCLGTPTACSPSGGVGDGIAGETAIRATVVNGSVRGMGNYGVRLGPSARVEGVHASSNGGPGISVDDNSVVRGNTVDRNGGFAGLGLGSGDTASGNTVSSNANFGVSAGFGVTVLGNSIRNNGKTGLAFGNGAGAYGNNALTGNGGGDDAPTYPQVSGNAVQIGTNLCGTDTTCP